VPNSDVHIFGIRHHGPGSARSLIQALDNLQPDIVLIEGPPDADSILPLAAREEMQPPLAILVYVPDEPRRCAFYPFAVFSPEWQAIQWAHKSSVPVRFMDLPMSIQLAMRPAKNVDEVEEPKEEGDAPDPSSPPTPLALEQGRDPLRALAEAAGYEDGERWWDHMVEQRASGDEVFSAILEAMSALREDADLNSTDPREPLREAYMRQTIRAAQREGHGKIAVVCGAWHGPALTNLGAAKADKAILDGLPKVKTAASWIPWTYSRLSYQTGYGAGIESPGWYHHLWTYGRSTNTRIDPPGDLSVMPPQDWGLGGRSPETQRPLRPDIVVPWLTQVAHLLREHDLDASPASIIEAVRLADCIAALRGRPVPGLPELNEATQTILCFGSDVPMKLIVEKLIVGERLGGVPDDAPAVPLQQDLQRQQKRLRIAPEAAQKVVDYDLRKPGDLERSELLHRLNLLGVPWGKPERGGGGKGTFHELWRLQWYPEFYIALIEKGVWGNTVIDAASAFASDAAAKAPDLPTLTRLLEAVMLARLPNTLAILMDRLEEVSAHASDIQHLMDALPPLANVLRYGDVRGTDTSMVGHTIDGLVARICVGLPAACASLDDDAADLMSKHIAATHGAIALLQNAEHLADWQEALGRLVDRPNIHGRLSGQCTRLLLDGGVYTSDEAGRHMSLALSAAVEPDQAAAWVEGFLAGSGLLLVHDQALWQILDTWVSSLGEEHFTNLLPLLRRTFSTFSAPERRQLGERAKAGRTSTATVDVDDDLDHERAATSIPYVIQLLGLSPASKA